MQKKKLDLNHLLAKYQGISQTSYGSPLRQHNHPTHPIEQQFYQYPQQSRTYQDPHPLPERPMQQQANRTQNNNFNMSKSQVENYLHSLRDEIKGEERAVNRQVQLSLKSILDNFQKNHQRLRKELLEMLDRAFVENQRVIREELARHSKNQSPEFAQVYRKISSLDQEIDRLLNSLRGPEYRKTIAEVVTRDFNGEISELRGMAASAKSSYSHSLGEVEFDRSRIETIKDNLHKLFFINRRNSGPINSNHIQEVSNSIFSVAKDKIVEQSQPQAQSRTRKSFFNFGSD